MKRDFKGVWIPKEIWLTKELSLIEKVFLVEVDSLDTSERGCYASNAHFAKFFGISKGRCTQILKQLEAKNWIKITLIRKKKRVVERQIRVLRKLNNLFRKLNNPPQKTKQPYLENAEGSNTEESNTFNNTNGKKKYIKKKRFSEPGKVIISEDEEQEYKNALADPDSDYWKL